MIIALNGKSGAGKDETRKVIQYLTRHSSLENVKYEDFHKHFGKTNTWQIKKYSDKLKDMVCILIGCTREQLEDQDFKATPLGEEWQGYQISWDCKPDEWEKFFKTEEEAIIYLNNDGAETDVESAYKYKLIRRIQLTPRDILQSLGTEYGRKTLHPNIWINALFADYYSGIKMSDYTESKWIITDSRFPNDVERVKSLGGICIRINRDSCNGRSNEHESETALDKYDGFDHVIDNNGSIEDLIEKVREVLTKENII